MKNIIFLFIACALTACNDVADNTDTLMQSTGPANSDIDSEDKNQETPPDTHKNPVEHVAEKVSEQAPNIADYQGVCPEAWGIVKGASLEHVEKFVQNYFFVPDGPGAMYSNINNFPQPDGSNLLKAGTYKMQDNIVDQEMVALFAAGSMTQCGFRLRCASDPGTWVSSCDS